jgi:hypothetical protein
VADPTGRGRTVVVARSNPDEPFREYNAIGPQVMQALASEESLGALAGIAVTASRVPHVLGPTIGVGAGLLAGSLSKYGIERARGFEQDVGLPEAISRASGEAGVGMAIDVILRGGLSMARSFVFRPGEQEAARRTGIQEVQQFAREIDLTPIARGQASEHPILRQMFSQTGTSRVFDELTESQRMSLINSWKSWRDSMGAQGGISRDALERAVMAQAYQLEGPLARQIVRANTPTDIYAAGRSLQEGLENFEQMSRQFINQLYDDALRTGQGVSFSTAGVRNVADTIRVGTPIRRADGTVSRAEGNVHNEIQSVLDDIASLPEVLAPDLIAGRMVQPYQQLKALRTRLFDLTKHDDGAVRGPARQLYASLTSTIENPVGGSRAFIDAWRNASSVNRQLESVLELNFVRRLMLSDSPEQVARQFMSPGNGSAVRMIEEVLEANPETRGNWQLFRNSFLTQITDNPAQGIAKLDAFRRANDIPTLRLLVSETEEQALRSFASEMVRHESGAIANVARRNFDEGEAGRSFIRTATRQDIDDYVAAVGGRESRDAISLRHSVLTDIADSASMLNNSGQQVMNPRRLNTILDDVIKTGRYDSLFTPEELRYFRQYQRYAAIIEQSADVGGQLQMASVAAGLKEPFKPSKFGSAAKTFISNTIVASLFARPAAFRELTRIPLTANDAARIRALAQALQVLNNELQSEIDVNR